MVTPLLMTPQVLQTLLASHDQGLQVIVFLLDDRYDDDSVVVKVEIMCF